MLETQLGEDGQDGSTVSDSARTDEVMSNTAIVTRIMATP
jgi:hypothetical protein